MSILEKIRNKGVLYSFGIVFNRIVPKWIMRVRRFNVYEMDPSPSSSPGISSTTVGWAVSEEEMLEAEQLTGPQRSVGVGVGDMRVCRASIDEKLVAAFWATSNVFWEDGLGIGYELDDDQAWLFGAYVDKPFRRRGIYSSILKFMTPNLIASGKEQVLLAVNPDNIGSRKVHEKYAARKVGSVVAIRFLNVAICSAKGDLSRDRWITLNAKRNPILIRFRNPHR